MTSNFKTILIWGGVFLSLTGCREEIASSGEETRMTVISDATARNGRLYFPNKESLQHHYYELKDAQDEVLANFVDTKEYIPLRPVITKNNERLVFEKIQTRIANLKNKNSNGSKVSKTILSMEDIINDIDDLEEIIGDDTYGAFLNEEAEIQVGSEIYKYTDVGLFIVEENKHPFLDTYLDANNISRNLLVPTNPDVQTNYTQSKPCLQILTLTPEIDYYNASTGCSTGSGASGSGGGSSVPPASMQDQNQQMINFVNSLPNCGTYSTLLQDLFGDSNMCVDQYESKYRVKTKAFNYNYYLVYNLGVKVKHQYKGWTGLWRKENAEQMRLGVILAEFSYDYSSYFNSNSLNSNRITSVFNGGNRLYFDAHTFWNPSNYYPGLYTMTGYSLDAYPKLFKDDYFIVDIIKYPTSNSAAIDYPLYAALQAGNNNLSASSLNNLFWNETNGVVKRLGQLYQSLGQSKPDNNITYAYNATPLGKLKIGKTLYRAANNVDNLEKSFDWGFQIGFNINPDSGSISPDLSGSALKKPNEFKVLMYGIVKRNGQWHGSKINTGL